MNREEIIKLASNLQNAASNPDKSVWVEASAGTGKTKVLSDRVLRLLLKDVNPAKILCLTYTKAAAVEMSTRIAGRLSRWAVMSDEDLYQELKQLLTVLPNDRIEYQKLEASARRLFAVLLDTPGGMKIQTIHSFCQEVLKRFPLEANISPYFEVMDERSSKEAINEVKLSLLDNEEMGYITANISEYKFPEIMSSITTNRNKITRILEQYPDIETLIEKIADSLGIKDNLEDLNLENLKQIAKGLAGGSATDISRSAEIAAAVASDSLAMTLKVRSTLLRKNNNTFLATQGAVKKMPNLNELIEIEAAKIRQFENKLIAEKLFEATKAVLYLASDLIKGYNEYKKRRSKLDYEDLIVLTRDLLSNPSVAQWIMFKLDGGISHVLVDEAQDTSPDQWQIIKYLTDNFLDEEGNKTVFVVGDRKQSIYSFQGADTVEFEKSYNHFKSKPYPIEDVAMDVSFRSTSAVLNMVDKVFLGTKHNVSRVGDAGKIEIWPIIEAKKEEIYDEIEDKSETVITQTGSVLLAKEIAWRIKRAVDNKEILASKDRPVRYKDFLILVQRRNSFVEEMVRECKNIGVRIAGIDKINLLEQIAIQDLIALGKFLLLPNDDLTLATVLKSPLFGLDDMDLFKICHERKSLLWTSLSNFPEYKEVYQTLQELLNMVDFIRPFELYSHVLTKLGGRKKFISRMGQDVEDGIDEFVNLTLNFEAEHTPVLQKFIHWIESDEIEIKRELEQSEIDAVRIMTVHGSKGLQAPIVILPDTVRVPSNKKEAKLLVEEDLLLFPLSSGHYDKIATDINDKNTSKILDEYNRLLYVALTRAEDRLCICGYKQKNEPSETSWLNNINQKIEEKIIETKQEAAIKKKDIEEEFIYSRPDFYWINTPAPEVKNLSKPYTPSKPDEEDNEPATISPLDNKDERRYYRGRIIHKLLQFLPQTEGDKKQIMREFLQKTAPDLSKTQQQRIVDEVNLLLNDSKFKSLFGKNSQAEVSIIGQAGDKLISGQVDRLVVNESEVLIVDYKTNRPAALTSNDVPKVYLKQMQSYKELLQKIYPEKTIKTAILWTDTAKLMEV